MTAVSEKNVRLGSFILDHRRAADLTQEELADKTALSVGGIRNLKLGIVHRPRRDTLKRLAIALGLDAAIEAHLVAIARRLPVFSASVAPRDYAVRWSPASSNLNDLLGQVIDDSGADVVVVICRRAKRGAPSSRTPYG